MIFSIYLFFLHTVIAYFSKTNQLYLDFIPVANSHIQVFVNFKSSEISKIIFKTYILILEIF